MSSSAQVLRQIASRLLGEPMVLRVEFLWTKVRAILSGGYVLDIYYNVSTGRYSFTLVKGSKRIMGWDNAPHHVGISTFPHHFHDVDGQVRPSDLTGDPLTDIEKVLDRLRAFLILR